MDMMNINRDSPYRVVNTRRLWWVHNGKLILVKLHFDPDIP